jgi:riboflavin kinase/FMN adenylyltransferase
MKVYHGIEEFQILPHSVVTLGTFDGVHAGHQEIIKRLTEIAAEEVGETVVLTFFPHPRMVLQPDDNDLKLITTMNERIELLRHYGVDHLIIQPFDKTFSRMNAVEFVRDILINKIGTKTLVIGYDHHFGRNREGSIKDLEEMSSVYKYRLEEIPKQVVDEVAISSTKIRNALLEGSVAPANKLLGHDFTLTGKIVDGEKMGRHMGFPTANISIAEPYKLIPATGIYAVTLKLDEVIYRGMLYVGYKPVFNGKKLSIEVNIFDFNQSIYNKDVTVYLKHRVRDDSYFASTEELKIKMEEDERIASEMLAMKENV